MALGADLLGELHLHQLFSFVQVTDKRQVSLMFNAAGRPKGNFPHLGGKSVKHLRFKDESEANALAVELAAITSAWCDQEVRAQSGALRRLPPRSPAD